MLLPILLLLAIFIYEGSSFLSLKVRNPTLFSILKMSDQTDLLEEMRRSLGERESPLDDAESESKQLLQGLRDLDRDPNRKANNAFVDWLNANGVWVKQESAWGRAPHPLVISSNTEDDGETCGRGLLAKESLSEGELMMTIPLDLCLTKAVSRELLGGNIITEDMDEYIAIALLLMSEKLKGSKSLWKPYFDVLPDAAEVYPSYIWREEELDLLKGSPVYAASQSLRSKLEREFSEVKVNILDRYAAQLPVSVDKYSKELFLWAFVMLFSRAARLSSKLSGEELALVPYADLMNHNPYSRTYIDAQRSGMPLISRNEEVAVYSDRPYKKFEQVFISYGEKGNADLLLLYGFALERNPFNSVDISVGLSKEDPLFTEKMNYLNRAGRGATSVRFPLQSNRYPSELVDFLRLLLVEAEDLGMQPIQQTDFNEPISPSLERRVLTTMINICESYLEQYPTTVDEDDNLIKDKGMFGALSRQQRMAIKLRASEKRILMSTITAIEEELKKLPSVAKLDGSIIPAGRSFDTRANVANVVDAVNQRNMAAWVDIKDADGNVIDRETVNGVQIESEAGDDGNTSAAASSTSTTTSEGMKDTIAERRRRRRRER